MYQYSLGMYEKAMPDDMPLQEKLQMAKECGFDHVEFCVDLKEERANRLNWTKEERAYWRNLSSGMGVAFTTFSLSLLRKNPLGVLDERRNQESFWVLEEGCRLAFDLGSRVLLINGYDVYDEPSTDETVARFYENLTKAVDLCARYGMVVGIENAEKPFCRTIADAVNICKRVPSPFLRVYGDIGNETNSWDGDGKKTVAGLLEGEGYITSLHLKDSLPGEYRLKDYGSGHVDFAACIEAAKKMHIHLFTAEIFCDSSRDYIAYAKYVSEFLRSFF